MRIGITGHRSLPENVAQQVKELLRGELATHEASELCGVSCIADGPDAWFAELVLEQGGRIEVVVPGRCGVPRGPARLASRHLRRALVQGCGSPLDRHARVDV